MKHPQYYLREVIENDFEDVRFRNTYSGRGMYGRTCVGITGPANLCQQVIAEAIIQAGIDSQKVQLGSNREETDEFFRQSVRTLLDYAEDSMGMNVVFYWPGLQSIPTEEVGP